jgi:hypothetical protein
MGNNSSRRSRISSRRAHPLGRWWAPGDIVIVLLVTGLSAFLIFAGVAGANGGALQVRVIVNGKEARVLPLDADKTFTIDGFQGQSQVEISGSQVRMVDSACPDKLCVRAGWISRPGESIICLPNRVVLEIMSGNGGPDAVNR